MLDHLWDDIAALAACSLTSRTWLPTVRLHLFDTITIAGLGRLEGFLTLLEHQCPSLGSIAPYVRSLSMDMQETSWYIDEKGRPRVAGHSYSEQENTVGATDSNHPILRVSKQLQNLRSLVLKDVYDVRPMFKEETGKPSLSIFLQLETIRLQNIGFNHLGQLVELVQASPKLTAISFRNVTWPAVHLGHCPQDAWIVNRAAAHKSSAIIQDLEFAACLNSVTSTIIQGLFTPSFKLHLRVLSIRAFDVNTFSTLLSSNACHTLESLRVDYCHSLHQEGGQSF